MLNNLPLLSKQTISCHNLSILYGGGGGGGRGILPIATAYTTTPCTTLLYLKRFMPLNFIYFYVAKISSHKFQLYGKGG